MTTTSTLTDSISSLGSASPSRAPSISRIYKQASQLFLTRQLAEAWEDLSPLVNPEQSPAQSDSSSLGSEVNGHHGTNGDTDHDRSASRTSQIATASKSARVKVWGLWLALVHEILILGSENGAEVFQQIESSGAGKAGSKRWKELVKKVQEGEIWENIVRVGYQGNEGAVDGEVVSNLATLLLTHAPSQTLTQHRLETYLSTTTSGPSPLQLSTRLEQEASPASAQSNGHPSHLPTQNGTSTPADLNTRLKLLEIYTLHVLPRNQEWDYARDFINMSELLDEDRKEAFLAALGGLREESEVQGRRESELMKRRQVEEEQARQREGEEGKRREAEERNRKTAAEMGLGRGAEKEVEHERPKQNGAAKPSASASSAPPKAATKKTPASSAKSTPSSSAAAKRPRPTAPPASFLQRASHTMAVLQRALLQMGSSVTSNPLVVLRFLFFIIAVVVAFGRRDVRDKVGRAWEKIKGTVGMGVKTTYL